MPERPADPFPEYDVLAKRDTPSWDAVTREAVEQRLMTERPLGVLTQTQEATLERLVARVAAQPRGRQPANTVALLMARIAEDTGEGYRPAGLPRFAECWREGLDAIEAEAGERHGVSFSALEDEYADRLLDAISQGHVTAKAWETLPARLFWRWRALPDIVAAHWSHPSLWSAMGFGGPANPRGYVRLQAGRRDPWEAKEER